MASRERAQIAAQTGFARQENNSESGKIEIPLLWETLDQMPDIIEPGLHVIIGPEKSGKTALSTAIAYESAQMIYNPKNPLIGYSTAYISTEEGNNQWARKYEEARMGELEEYCLKDGIGAADELLIYLQEFAIIRKGKVVVIDSFDALPSNERIKEKGGEGPYKIDEDEEAKNEQTDRVTWVRELADIAEKCGLSIIITVHDRSVHDRHDDEDETAEELKERYTNVNPYQPSLFDECAAIDTMTQVAKSITWLSPFEKNNHGFGIRPETEERRIIHLEGAHQQFNTIAISRQLERDLLNDVQTFKIPLDQEFFLPKGEPNTYFIHEPVSLTDSPYSIGVMGIPQDINYDLVVYYTPPHELGEPIKPMEIVGYVERFPSEDGSQASTREKMKKLIGKDKNNLPKWMRKYLDTSDKITALPCASEEEGLTMRVDHIDGVRVNIPGDMMYGIAEFTGSERTEEANIDMFTARLNKWWFHPHTRGSLAFCDPIVLDKDPRYSIGLISFPSKGSVRSGPIDGYSFVLLFTPTDAEEPQIVGHVDITPDYKGIAPHKSIKEHLSDQNYEEKETIPKWILEYIDSGAYLHEQVGVVDMLASKKGDELLKAILTDPMKVFSTDQLRMVLMGISDIYATRVCGAIEDSFPNSGNNGGQLEAALKRAKPERNEWEERAKIIEVIKKMDIRGDLVFLEDMIFSLIENIKGPRINNVNDDELENTLEKFYQYISSGYIERSEDIATEVVWDSDAQTYVVRTAVQWNMPEGYTATIQHATHDGITEVELVHIGVFTDNNGNNPLDISAVIVPADTPNAAIRNTLIKRFTNILPAMQSLNVFRVIPSDDGESVEVISKPSDFISNYVPEDRIDHNTLGEEDDGKIDEESSDIEDNGVLHTIWQKTPHPVNKKYVMYIAQ